MELPGRRGAGDVPPVPPGEAPGRKSARIPLLMGIQPRTQGLCFVVWFGFILIKVILHNGSHFT